MKTLLPLLFCCSLALCAAAGATCSLSGHHSAMTDDPIAPLHRSIVPLPADTLPYTMEEARCNIKAGRPFLVIGLVSVSPPVLYLAALVGAPVLPQLLFVLGALSLVWGGLKFIQGRIRLRRLRAHRRNSPGG